MTLPETSVTHRDAAKQERAARARLYPRSGNVIPLGASRKEALAPVHSAEGMTRKVSPDDPTA